MSAEAKASFGEVDSALVLRYAARVHVITVPGASLLQTPVRPQPLAYTGPRPIADHRKVALAHGLPELRPPVSLPQ